MFGAASTAQSLQSPAGLSTEACELLGSAVCRTLCDKQYEKRKTAALDIEQIVRCLLRHLEPYEASQKVKQILSVLVGEFLDNPQSNIRKGGLIGLASCSIALERHFANHQSDIVPPILNCFSDPEPRVRYYACESLYNVAKVARGNILVYFNEVFDGLCKIYADVDVEVKHGSEYIDRLIKELITQSADFDYKSFVPLLAQKVRVKNPHIRHLVLSWLLVLNSVPGLDLASDVPLLLDGIFGMLCDANSNVRQSVQSCLAELLVSIKKKDIARESQLLRDVATIVVKFVDSPDTTTRMTSLCWLTELVVAADPSADSVRPAPVIVPVPPREPPDIIAAAAALRSNGQLQSLLPEMLNAVLHNVGDKDDDIRGLAYNFHTCLFLAVYDVSTDDGTFAEKMGQITAKTASRMSMLTCLDITASLPQVVDILFSKLNESLDRDTSRAASLQLRSVCLQWVSLLLHQNPTAMYGYLEQLMDPLFYTLDDPDAQVVADALSLIALISSQGHMFGVVAGRLFGWFSRDAKLLAERGRLIIRKLCTLVNAKSLFCNIAKQINDEPDLNTAHQLVQIFNWILLTAKETKALREELLNSDDPQLFETLILPWFHNGVATLSLCLWANEWDVAMGVVEKLACTEPSVEFLVELDQLVHLLESPTFGRLRMQALDVRKNPQLAKTLTRLAMLLPQSPVAKHVSQAPQTSFETLHQRLELIKLTCLMDSMSLPDSAGTTSSASAAAGPVIMQPYSSRDSAAAGGPQGASGSRTMSTTQLLSEFSIVLKRHEDFVAKKDAAEASTGRDILFGGMTSAAVSSSTAGHDATVDRPPTSEESHPSKAKPPQSVVITSNGAALSSLSTTPTDSPSKSANDGAKKSSAHDAAPPSPAANGGEESTSPRRSSIKHPRSPNASAFAEEV